MKLFITTMGYAGAGKSHFAKQVAHKLHAVRLNSDSMRNSVFDNPDSMEPEGNVRKEGNRIVFGAIDYSASEVLKAGYSIVYDAKVNRRSERQKNANIATKYGAQHVSVWVQVPREVAVERTENREVTLDQGRLTLEQREARGSDYIEEPDETELTVIINGELPFEEQYTMFIEQLQRKGILHAGDI